MFAAVQANINVLFVLFSSKSTNLLKNMHYIVCFNFSCSVNCCRKHRENNCEVLVQKSTDTAKKNEEEIVVKRRKIDDVESTIPEEKLEQISKLICIFHVSAYFIII